MDPAASAAGTDKERRRDMREGEKEREAREREQREKEKALREKAMSERRPRQIDERRDVDERVREGKGGGRVEARDGPRPMAPGGPRDERRNMGGKEERKRR